MVSGMGQPYMYRVLSDEIGDSRRCHTRRLPLHLQSPPRQTLISWFNSCAANVPPQLATQAHKVQSEQLIGITTSS